MRIVHLSATPLVGAPGAICRALNTQPGIEARWAVLDTQVGAYDKMVFDLDLSWATDRDQIIELVGQCDVLHLHNTIGLDCRHFAPLDFKALWDRGVPILRQFHSNPEFIARSQGCSVAELMHCPIPKLVIAQFQERYYPQARLVPNLSQVVDSSQRPVRRDDRPLRVGYAPSRFVAGRSSRWDTKGYPETLKMLRQLVRTGRRHGLTLEIDVIEQVSHAECLARKMACDVFIDDLVTGSYHLNTLEALNAGIACLCYLDRRTQQALTSLTGRSDFPVLSVGLEDAREVLLGLCSNRQAVSQLGRWSREWMRQHWSADWAARHFLDAYSQVCRSPREAFAARFDPEDPAQVWHVTRLHDHLWQSRQQHWPPLPPAWWLAARGRVGRLARGLGLR